MTKHQVSPAFNVAAIFVIAMALLLQALFTVSVSADQIVNRKLTLMSGDTGPFDGGSKPGGNVRHNFEFTVPSTASQIGSIEFEYCTTAADVGALTCVTPTGLNTSGATLNSEAGSGATGFSITNPSNGVVVLTKAAAAAPSNGDLKFILGNVINPTTEGTFFVRIYTYSSIDGTGTPIDNGTVAASTAEQIIVSGTMPESLVFCTGANIDKVGGVVDCSTATPGDIEFNQLFSPTDTASAISEMAASTNAGFGYVITVNGPTLTSGSNTIAGISASSGSASTKGIPQFGLNLVENTSAAAPGFDPGAPIGILTPSANIDSVSDGINLNGRAFGGYATPDTFKFDPTPGENIVADSNFDATGTPDPTDAQIFTVSYIANVPGSQPAGTYTSTLTYICTPTF